MTRPTLALALAALLAGPAFADDRPGLTIELRAFSGGPIVAEQDPPGLGGFPVQLILDDGSTEGQSGVNGAAAAQFLWFSRFDPPGQDVLLEEVQVLFPPGANMAASNAVQIVVLRDDDGDPANGADFVAGFDATIQAVDGAAFSVFPVDPAVPLAAADDVLIGVVPRFIDTGATSPTLPAAVDTTASQGRSFITLWSGDPPAAPSLPSDGATTLVNGNWMIRGFGSPAGAEPPVVEVPTLADAGLAALATVLALLGAAISIRRRG